MKKKRKTVEMKLDNYLADQETKNNVMYAMWCADVKFFGFDSKDSGHILWTKEFIKKAKLSAYEIQFEEEKINYSKATEQVYKKVARRLTPEEVIKAVKIEYKNDYALLQFKIIHYELKTNKSRFAKLFLPEIQRLKWVGIFYGEVEYEAFKYIVEELPKSDTKKVLFKIIWSRYNKILIKCKGGKWDEWVHKEYFPSQKLTKVARKWDGVRTPLYIRVEKIEQQYHNPKVFEYSYKG